MELNDTAKLPQAAAQKINAVAALAAPHGLLPFLTITVYSSESIQLELRDKNGNLVWRDFTFSRDFIQAFKPYVTRDYRF